MSKSGKARREASRLSFIIARAKRMGNVKDGLVVCDHCDTPASRSLSLNMSWTGCAPCMLGEADSFDDSDLIAVDGSPRA